MKNTNDTLTQTVTLKVIELNSTITAAVSPASASIAAGQTADFVATFSVPNDTTVSSYGGKFEASSDKAAVTKDFSIHVLPGEEAKVQINSSFADLKTQVLNFWKELNDTKGVGVNVSATDSIFAQVKAKLDEAEAALALGTDQGYFTASQLIEEIRNLLDTAKAQLKVDTQAAGFVFPVNPLYIGIGVGIAVVGFLVYLFLPTKKAGGFKVGSPGEKAGAVAGKVTGAAGAVKDTTNDQFKKLQEKFKLKREYKYKYEE